MALVYWTADGAGKGVGKVPKTLVRWIRSKGSPALIVNGGDVYNSGTPKEFDKFFDQMDEDVSDLCETPGNHDWKTTSTSAPTGEIPAGYEGFWSDFPPPQSRQPIDRTKRGGARYEHVIDINGWRLLFLDTGLSKDRPWPMGDPGRVDWLRRALAEREGRAKIVFAHHSRLSSGKHGDNPNIDALWQTLFDDGSTFGTEQPTWTCSASDTTIRPMSTSPKF